MKRIEKLTHPEPLSESLQKQGFIQVSFSTEDVIEKLNEVVTALNELAEQHEKHTHEHNHTHFAETKLKTSPPIQEDAE